MGVQNIAIKRFGNSDNAIAAYDESAYARIVGAWGDVAKSTLDDSWLADKCTVTATGTSPITASVLPDAVALITSGGSDFDGDNVQMVGSMFKLEANKPLYFGAKVTINEATQSDLVVGMFGVDTTLTAASSGHALAVSAGGVGFTKLDNVTAGYVKAYTTATEIASASALTMDTDAHIYELFWDGSQMFAYVDNELKATFDSDSITTEVLTPSIAFRTGSGAAKTCTLHWMRCFQARS